MESTISAITQGANNFNPQDLLANPFVQYFISPAVAISVVLWLAYNILNLGELKQKFTNSLKDIDDLQKDNKKLLSHVDIIKTHLVTTAGLNANLFGPGSPLKLLPKGIEILETSGFKQIYLDNKEWFIEELKKHNIETLAGIDDASMIVLERCKNEDKYAHYKEIAFQNGIPLDTFIRILSIYLRDEAAKELLK